MASQGEFIGNLVIKTHLRSQPIPRIELRRTTDVREDLRRQPDPIRVAEPSPVQESIRGENQESINKAISLMRNLTIAPSSVNHILDSQEPIDSRTKGIIEEAIAMMDAIFIGCGPEFEKVGEDAADNVCGATIDQLEVFKASMGPDITPESFDAAACDPIWIERVPAILLRALFENQRQYVVKRNEIERHGLYEDLLMTEFERCDKLESFFDLARSGVTQALIRYFLENERI